MVGVLGDSKINYRLWLQEKLDSRRCRNPRYSLRSYAKFLKLAPSTLSEILSGKRKLTLELAVCIANREALEPEEKRQFLAPFLGEMFRKTEVDSNFEQIELDQYALIADWYHFAILSLASLKNNRSDSAWVAQRLNITRREARTALDRLFRLGVIKKAGRGFRPVGKALATPSGVSSAAIRKAHHQLIERAQEVLDRVPPEERDFSAIIIAADEGELSKMKARIREFRREFHKDFDKGDANTVFACQFLLFPLTENRR